MRFVIEGYIVPYVRMTHRSKHADPRARRYLSSKAAIVLQFHQQMQALGYSMIDGQTPFGISLDADHSAGHRADLDNILKAVLDAGSDVVYPDDRWCDAIERTVRTNTGTDKAVFEVWTL